MELEKERWNENLKVIKPDVKNIFYKGNIDLLLDSSPRLAIVGSRRMTEYGRRIVEKWMPILTQSKVTIVSGFMYGVDQAAHKACLDNGGKTIAVLGWGIENKISDLDMNLYQNILKVDSLILSEWQEMSADRSTFPQRNRIVAGISDAVLVVEGSNKSGSMITARLATRFRKKLMAVPGQVTSRVSEGTNGLVRAGVARMVTSAEEVLDEMGLLPGQLKFNVQDVGNDPMLSLLVDGDRTVDELVRLLKLSAPEIQVKLTQLTLSGVICESSGKYRMM